jgi:hypothetical protein
MQRNSRSGRIRQGFDLGEQFSPVAQLPLFEVAALRPLLLENCGPSAWKDRKI